MSYCRLLILREYFIPRFNCFASNCESIKPRTPEICSSFLLRKHQYTCTCIYKICKICDLCEKLDKQYWVTITRLCSNKRDNFPVPGKSYHLVNEVLFHSGHYGRYILKLTSSSRRWSVGTVFMISL